MIDGAWYIARKCRRVYLFVWRGDVEIEWVVVVCC